MKWEGRGYTAVEGTQWSERGTQRVWGQVLGRATAFLLRWEGKERKAEETETGTETGTWS